MGTYYIGLLTSALALDTSRLLPQPSSSSMERIRDKRLETLKQAWGYLCSLTA